MAMGFEWVVMATAAAGSGGSEVGWSCTDVREEMGCGRCTGGDGTRWTGASTMVTTREEAGNETGNGEGG
ncbi:hypothetical protein OsJ_34292 [Oryza sativa Japonica Group]|uniref:Uncharacterized protein n=2 Tax=Oryza sativa subsp. japonica TaxID=39947 RepID=A0A8J8XRZ1_ORYSJ|nr:hypothetical protein LOC_Os11g35900 [Oryza sativa Japonica Group]EEE52296.1 hypothetical protein OsJ_34292 [Oryza sativa Japonica Group]